MAKVTIITNDKCSKIIERTTRTMSEQVNAMICDWPFVSMRVSNAVVLRDDDGYRCIIQEG